MYIPKADLVQRVTQYWFTGNKSRIFNLKYVFRGLKAPNLFIIYRLNCLKIPIDRSRAIMTLSFFNEAVFNDLKIIIVMTLFYQLNVP